MNEINETTKELTISVANLILNGKSKEQIMEQLKLNSTSVDRMVNIILPQIDSGLHENVMDYIELQHNKKQSNFNLDTKIEIAKQKQSWLLLALTQEERNELVVRIGRQIVSGESQETIAREYGVTGVTIGRWLNAYLPQVDNDLYEKAMNKKNRKSREKNSNELAIKIADYIIAHQCSLKGAGEHFGIQRGSVDYYINKVLPKVDGQKFKQIRNMVDSKKKPSTSTAPTQNGLQKITYVFNADNGTDMYNSVVICDWILKNNCSIKEAAEHFSTAPEVIKSNISYMEHLDKSKYGKVISIAYKGKYDGLKYQNAQGTNLHREYVKNQNAHSICDYVIANEASYDEVAVYFCISKQTIKRNIERMKELDFDKYTKTMRVLKKPKFNENIEKSDEQSGFDIELSKDSDSSDEPTVKVVSPVDEQTMVDDAISVVENVDKEEQSVKMSFWQRVKFVFGFAN